MMSWLPFRTPVTSPGVKRRDYRAPTAIVALALLALAGYFFSTLSGRSADPKLIEQPRAHSGEGFDGLPNSSASMRGDPSESIAVEQEMAVPDQAASSAQQTLKEARKLIRTKQYAEAIRYLNQSSEQLKAYPEAYVVLGQALEGQRDFTTARDFYNTAINRDPLMAEAYWGYATTSEGLGDLESALGGMRSFLHTQAGKDPYRLKVAQARSAIWEWESKLGRGAWGPTKGVPPGFTAEDLKRDGKGVGIKMPVPGTEDAAGNAQSEVKSQDKFKLFKQ